jgi:uncharacterized protein YeaO (DUF488 family)
MAIAVKRVYEQAARADGTRILVDRLWPRGLSKAAAAVHAWLRDLAPSDGLRKWFHANPEAWSTFRNRYLKELTCPEAGKAVEELHALAGQHPRVTLLFASRNEERNNAVVLKEFLEGMRKPPTGTGPGAVKGLRMRQAARRPR